MTVKVKVHDSTLNVDLYMWEVDAEEARRRDTGNRFTIVGDNDRKIPAKNPGGRGH